MDWKGRRESENVIDLRRETGLASALSSEPSLIAHISAKALTALNLDGIVRELIAAGRLGNGLSSEELGASANGLGFNHLREGFNHHARGGTAIQDIAFQAGLEAGRQETSAEDVHPGQYAATGPADVGGSDIYERLVALPGNHPIWDETVTVKGGAEIPVSTIFSSWDNMVGKGHYLNLENVNTDEQIEALLVGYDNPMGEELIMEGRWDPPAILDEPSVPTEAVQLRQAQENTLVVVQQQLKELGLHDGEISENWTPEVNSSVALFIAEIQTTDAYKQAHAEIYGSNPDDVAPDLQPGPATFKAMEELGIDPEIIEAFKTLKLGDNVQGNDLYEIPDDAMEVLKEATQNDVELAQPETPAAAPGDPAPDSAPTPQ